MQLYQESLRSVRVEMVFCPQGPDTHTKAGRNCTPLARDEARVRAVRSLVSSRSYSARDPRTPIIMRPAAVDEG